MNTGQTMITILAMLLLSITIVTVNRGLLTTNGTMYQNRTDIVAVSLANSLLEKATSLNFDEKAIDNAIKVETSLTPVASLGFEGSTKGVDGQYNEEKKSPDNFDDIDDFNCYRTTPKEDSIDVPGSTIKMKFYTLCSVDYINTSNPNAFTVSLVPTWHKRIKLKIWHPNFVHDPNDNKKSTDTVIMSTIYSYWYFR